MDYLFPTESVKVVLNQNSHFSYSKHRYVQLRYSFSLTVIYTDSSFKLWLAQITASVKTEPKNFALLKLIPTRPLQISWQNN